MYNFSNASRAIWGKKDSECNDLWLPLAIHLADCVAVANKLWYEWISDSVKRKISSDMMDENDALRLFLFLAAIHDIGKATPVFQSKPTFPKSTLIDDLLLNKLVANGMPIKPYNEFQDANRVYHALAGESLLREAGCDLGVASIVGAHHGNPVEFDMSNQYGFSTYPQHYYMKKEGKLKWRAVQNEFFEYALQCAGYTTVDDIPIVEQDIQVLLSGLLIMVDWIASNKDFFPYISIEQDGSNLDLVLRCENAWNQLGLTESWIPSNDGNKPSFCEERFKFSANSLQSVVIKVANSVNKGGIMVIEAPMGVGKTEAALLAAEIYAQKIGCTGVFFALPTQATSDGIFPRFLDWMEKLDEYDKHSLRLVHGKAQFNEQYQGLKGFGRGIQVNIDPGDEDQAVIIHSWFEGNKKSMLADFVVGTVDQLLLLALQQKHLMLRHLGLASKVVIVDECHAYDAYMSRYLQRSLHWLSAYGVPVIILSATLPIVKRKEFIAAYLGISKKKLKSLDAPWMANTAYPLITYTDNEQVFQKSVDIDSGSIGTVKMYRLESSQLVDKLMDRLSEGGCVGLVVNTVKRAQEFASRLKECFCDEAVVLIHSAFLAPDRILKEQKLIQELGKGGDRPNLRIVIGTQVLEQSLDIDFDMLITDLAPMDLLLQRIGRLHRHKQKRPTKLMDATCYVMEADEELESGAEAVYGEYLLTRTKVFLPQIINLPQDIATLVQKVYDETIEPSPRPEGYDEMKERFHQLIDRKEQKADIFRIKEVRKNWSLASWLNRKIDTQGVKGEAAVRDTDPSIEVLLLQRTKGGVKMLGSDMVLMQDQAPSQTIARLIARQSIRLPRPLCQNWIIETTIDELEKENLRHLTAWQESSWLKGELFLLLNEDYIAHLNGYKMTYTNDLGLEHEKE